MAQPALFEVDTVAAEHQPPESEPGGGRARTALVAEACSLGLEQLGSDHQVVAGIFAVAWAETVAASAALVAAPVAVRLERIEAVETVVGTLLEAFAAVA